MNTQSKEVLEDCNQRRKSIASGGGLAGGRTRRYSIGITSSRKSIGDEGNIVPNYLRASTGSCHDFCKFGKKHEHSKSSIPIKFKTTTVVNKDRVAKTSVSLEKKKMTLKPATNPAESVKVTEKVVLLPSKKPQVSKPSSPINGKSTKNELKTLQRSVRTSSEGSNGGIKIVKKADMPSKTGGVKKVAPKASVSRAASLNTVKHKGVKRVSPLKDQNLMRKNEPKQTIDDNVLEVKPETMEFDFIQSSMESVNVVGEESMITRQVYESSELFSDKELLEGSLVQPAVVESSQSCSDKEELEEDSSESFYDDEVLEGESEYTDDEEVEVEVSDGSETANVNEMEASAGNLNKIPRKGRTVVCENKDDKAVKLRFRRGKILDLQSENNGPRRLKFRKRVIKDNEDGQNISTRSYKNKTLDKQKGNEDKQHVAKRSFEKKYVEEKKDSNNAPESIVLKHQGEKEKKDAQGLFNNVIEETASKLVESRKSKVKALVGAFETVISLQDGKS